MGRKTGWNETTVPRYKYKMFRQFIEEGYSPSEAKRKTDEATRNWLAGSEEYKQLRARAKALMELKNSSYYVAPALRVPYYALIQSFKKEVVDGKADPHTWLEEKLKGSFRGLDKSKVETLLRALFPGVLESRRKSANLLK